MSKKTKRPVAAATPAPVNPVARPAGNEFNPDYSHIKKDLKTIGILAGTFFVVLVVLSFFLN
jgi:hypothetical protein